MNKCIFTGRLAREVEVKSTQSGKTYLNNAIVVERKFNREKVDFINIIAWEKTAEFMLNYLNKGRKIVVEGRLEISNYTDKDGNDRQGSQIVVEAVEFADSVKTEVENKEVALAFEAKEDELPF